MPYTPELLPDSILSDEVLNAIPKIWKEHSDQKGVRHLLKIRHHLEGQYKVAKTNHTTARTNLANAMAGAQTVQRQAELVKANIELNRSHDALRAAELDIYHEIENVIERKHRRASFVVSILAVLISGVALYNSMKAPNVQDVVDKVYSKKFVEAFLDSHESDISEKILTKVSQKNEEELGKIKTEINRNLSANNATIQSDLDSIKGELKVLKRFHKPSKQGPSN